MVHCQLCICTVPDAALPLVLGHVLGQGAELLLAPLLLPIAGGVGYQEAAQQLDGQRSVHGVPGPGPSVIWRTAARVSSSGALLGAGVNTNPYSGAGRRGREGAAAAHVLYCNMHHTCELRTLISRLHQPTLNGN